MSAPQETPPESTFDIQIFRRKYFAPLIVFLLFLKLAVSLVWLGMTLPVQWDLSFPEAAVVARAVDVAQGDRPYHDWTEWPHAFAPYGPMTYYPAGWIGAFLSDAEQAETVRIVGRLKSQLAMFGVLALAVAMVRRLGLPWLWALLVMPAALAWERLFAYVVSFRPDLPQVFFSLLALFLASGGRSDRRLRAVAALAALFVAFWFKATSWGVLAVLAFWLRRDRGTVRSIAALAAFALAGLVPVFILNGLWEGHLWMNLVGSLDNGADSGNFLKIFSQVPLIGWFILLFGLANAVVQWSRAPMESPLFLLALGTLCSTAASLLATFKVGADINYYLEPFVLCSVLTVHGIWTLWVLPEVAIVSDPSPVTVLRREIPLTILLLPLLLLVSGLRLMEARDRFETILPLWNEPAIVGEVKEVSGPVLSVFPCVVLESAGPDTILDHFQYQVLADRGLLKRQELLNRLRARDFDAVVMEGSSEGFVQDYFLPEFRETLFENYYISKTYGENIIVLRRRIPQADQLAV